MPAGPTPPGGDAGPLHELRFDPFRLVVGVVNLICVQAQAADAEGDADQAADYREVQVDAYELHSATCQEEEEALQVVAEVDMSHARDDGKCGGQRRAPSWGGGRPALPVLGGGWGPPLAG